MSGAIPPLPNKPSWRGAQLKHRDNFTFTFIVCFFILTYFFVWGGVQPLFPVTVNVPASTHHSAMQLWSEPHVPVCFTNSHVTKVFQLSTHVAAPFPKTSFLLR
jgi:hypothetical protein